MDYLVGGVTDFESELKRAISQGNAFQEDGIGLLSSHGEDIRVFAGAEDLGLQIQKVTVLSVDERSSRQGLFAKFSSEIITWLLMSSGFNRTHGFFRLKRALLRKPGYGKYGHIQKCEL